MNNTVKKGNLAEVKAASDEGIEITLLRKDFSKQSFVRINLNKSAISKCVFHETKFFANEYTSCDFISCDFTKADFLNVKFNDCKFHECKFDEATLQEVNFENCSIMTCSFANVQLKNDVIGIDEKDLNVIHEQIDEIEDDLTKLGFSKNDEGEMSICAQENNGPKVCVVVTPDSELGQKVFRVMLFVNDESILSDTFDKEGDDLEMISRIIKAVINAGNKKIEQFFAENENDDQVETAKAALANIKSQFKQYFNEAE